MRIVVAVLDGELTCKILNKKRQSLESANDSLQPIAIGDDASLLIEGVVIHLREHMDKPVSDIFYKNQIFHQGSIIIVLAFMNSLIPRAANSLP